MTKTLRNLALAGYITLFGGLVVFIDPIGVNQNG